VLGCAFERRNDQLALPDEMLATRCTRRIANASRLVTFVLPVSELLSGSW